jgi:hypothetical protein
MRVGQPFTYEGLPCPVVAGIWDSWRAALLRGLLNRFASVSPTGAAGAAPSRIAIRRYRRFSTQGIRPAMNCLSRESGTAP